MRVDLFSELLLNLCPHIRTVLLKTLDLGNLDETCAQVSKWSVSQLNILLNLARHSRL